MCSAEIITKFVHRVCLDSKFLTAKWAEHLEEKVRESLLTKRSSKIGCILEILEVNTGTFTRNRVRLGNVFHVPVTVRTLRPVVGAVVSAKVSMILSTGIIGSAGGDQLKIFVASKSMAGYTIDAVTQVCTNVETGKEIRYEDEVLIELTTVQYRTEKKDFSCCGRLKTEDSK